MHCDKISCRRLGKQTIIVKFGLIQNDLIFEALDFSHKFFLVIFS